MPQESREAYYKRIINLSSHSKHNGDEISIVEENDRNISAMGAEQSKRAEAKDFRFCRAWSESMIIAKNMEG